MTKKLYEYNLKDVLWDMYSTKDFDKVLKCTRPLDWHRFGRCDVCNTKAFRFTHLLYDRLYVLEDSEVIRTSMQYLLAKYRTDFFTRREKNLPIVSTAPIGSNGYVFKAEFYLCATNTLVFVARTNSTKISYFDLVIEHFKGIFKCLLLLFNPESKSITEHKLIRKKPKTQSLSRRRRIARSRRQLKLKRLVNPNDFRDIFYVPYADLLPLIVHYDGDRDRAERRWWRRKIKQRNKQYRKP